MAVDARISTALPGHPKTKRIIKRLGAGAAWYLVRLFLWAAENKSDGDLTGMTNEDIEIALDWPGENGALINELVAVRFLDGSEGAFKIHDWAEHNPWANGADMRAAKARWNAVKRHHGVREADKQVPEWASVLRADRDADSSDLGASSIESDVLCSKNRAASIDNHAVSIRSLPKGADAASTQKDAGSIKKSVASNAPSPSPSPSPSQEQKPPAEKLASPAELELPSWIDREAWAGFAAMRRKERHPLTDRAAGLILKKLDSLRSEGNDPAAVLDQSTRNGWRDVFELKQKPAKSAGADVPDYLVGAR